MASKKVKSLALSFAIFLTSCSFGEPSEEVLFDLCKQNIMFFGGRLTALEKEGCSVYGGDNIYSCAVSVTISGRQNQKFHMVVSKSGNSWVFENALGL